MSIDADYKLHLLLKGKYNLYKGTYVNSEISIKYNLYAFVGDLCSLYLDVFIENYEQVQDFMCRVSENFVSWYMQDISHNKYSFILNCPLYF